MDVEHMDPHDMNSRRRRKTAGLDQCAAQKHGKPVAGNEGEGRAWEGRRRFGPSERCVEGSGRKSEARRDPVFAGCFVRRGPTGRARSGNGTRNTRDNLENSEFEIPWRWPGARLSNFAIVYGNCRYHDSQTPYHYFSISLTLSSSTSCAVYTILLLLCIYLSPAFRHSGHFTAAHDG